MEGSSRAARYAGGVRPARCAHELLMEGLEGLPLVGAGQSRHEKFAKLAAHLRRAPLMASACSDYVAVKFRAKDR